MKRTTLLLALLAFTFHAIGAARADERADRYARAFDDLIEIIDEGYAYLDESGLDASRLREVYEATALSASGDDAFVRVVKDVVDELCDHHAGAWPNASDDRRLVPSTTDLWAEWVDGRAVITAVRAGSPAFAHGFRPGMEIESIDGSPVEDAIRDELPRALDVPSLRAQGWALRVALSGRLGSPVRVVAKDSDQHVDATFTPGRFTRPDGALVAERLDGGAGYVRFNNSLGENDTVAAFDDALETLRDAPALIIDLRDTPGGGNTTVARGILGRLTAEKRVYQMHSLPMEVREHGIERSWAEFVSPRGTFAYTGEVFVLVGRWTGSMGEGMTLGLDAMGATVIGGPMARLLGATNSYQLGDVDAWVSLPTERLYHADGTAREAFVPGVRVGENGAAFGSAEDEGLRAALQRSTAAKQ